MQASLLSLFLIAAVATPTAAPTPADQAREFARDFSAANLDELYIDFPIGELEIEGANTDRIDEHSNRDVSLDSIAKCGDKCLTDLIVIEEVRT